MSVNKCNILFFNKKKKLQGNFPEGHNYKNGIKNFSRLKNRAAAESNLERQLTYGNGAKGLVPASSSRPDDVRPIKRRH